MRIRKYHEITNSLYFTPNTIMTILVIRNNKINKEIPGHKHMLKITDRNPRKICETC